MAINLDDYAPFDSGTGSNVMAERWRKFIPHIRETGVISQSKEPGSTTEFEVFGDSTGMQVKARAGECFIEGHWGESTSEKILPIQAAHATLARIDRVVLRADLVAENIALAVKTGAPGSTTAPSLEESATAFEIPLAKVQVNPAVVTITAGNVTDERSRIGSGMFSSFTPTLYAAGNNLPENAAALPVGMGSGALTPVCRYRRDGRVLYIRWYFDWGTAPYNGQTGAIYTTLPPGMVARGPQHRIDCHLWTTNGGNFDWPGTAVIGDGDNKVWPFFPRGTANMGIFFYTIVTNATWTARVPDIAWPEGGHLVISGVIEVE